MYAFWRRVFFGCLILLALLAGCSRGDGVPVDVSVSVDEPNRFARFFNPIAGLQAGDYTIVAATFTAAQAGSFTVTVTYDDGEVQKQCFRVYDEIKAESDALNIRPVLDQVVTYLQGYDYFTDLEVSESAQSIE